MVYILRIILECLNLKYTRRSVKLMDFQEWKDFEGKAWKNKIMLEISSKATIHLMREMIASLLVLRIEQKNCGMKF